MKNLHLVLVLIPVFLFLSLIFLFLQSNGKYAEWARKWFSSSLCQERKDGDSDGLFLQLDETHMLGPGILFTLFCVRPFVMTLASLAAALVVVAGLLCVFFEYEGRGLLWLWEQFKTWRHERRRRKRMSKGNANAKSVVSS